MPQNWWRTLFATDLFCAPEIVPGYNRADHLNFRFLTSRFKQEERSYKRLLYILILAGWFGPAYFYRICIKSTCWFYMPLVYVVRRPALSENPGLLRDLLWRDPMEWCRRFLAALTLTGFAMTTLLPPLAAFLKSTMPLIMVSPLEYLFLIDIRSIKLWQWFSLGSASITFGILSLIGTFSIYYAHSHLDSRLARKTYNRARTLETFPPLFSLQQQAFTPCCGLLPASTCFHLTSNSSYVGCMEMLFPQRQRDRRSAALDLVGPARVSVSSYGPQNGISSSRSSLRPRPPPPLVPPGEPVPP
jgi:hypothetical protein